MSLAIMEPRVVFDDQRIDEFSQFYDQIFSADIGPLPKRIKQNPDGMDWFLILPKWLSYTEVLSACERNFEVWRRREIILPDCIDFAYEHRRPQDGTYAIALFSGVTGERKYASVSVEELNMLGIGGVTLLERLLLELWFFWKTGEHLDTGGQITMCHGTRLNYGQHPVVAYQKKQVQIYSFAPTHAVWRIKPRQVQVLI